MLPDIEGHIDFFEEMPAYDCSLYVHKKMKTNEENSLELLKEVKPILEGLSDFSNDGLFGALKAYADEKGYKTGYMMWPLRIAVSGRAMTPAGATEIMEVLGKEESLSRIDAAIAKLEGR